MYTTIRAAALNFRPRKWQKAWNADRLEEMFTKAVEQGAQLVVATEGLLDGYPVMNAIFNPALREKMVETAEPLDGPFVTRFRTLAAQLHACLVFGTTTREGRRDLYNTAVFIDQQGEICGTHNKVQFAEGYHSSWFFNRLGKRIRAFDTPFGRCGMMICNDRWHPLIARTLCLDGAGYLCILAWGSLGRAQDKAVLARARENGVTIIQANVGCNLFIAKGEVVARERGRDIITLADVDIPAPPSTRNARIVERHYLEARPALEAEALAVLMKHHKMRGQHVQAIQRNSERDAFPRRNGSRNVARG